MSGKDLIAGFEGAFDYSTISGLIDHLREHADRTAGGSAGDATYDPETLNLEHDAAEALEKLKISRNYEKDCALAAASKAEHLSYKLVDAEAELSNYKEFVEALRRNANHPTTLQLLISQGASPTTSGHNDELLRLQSRVKELMETARETASGTPFYCEPYRGRCCITVLLLYEKEMDNVEEVKCWECGKSYEVLNHGRDGFELKELGV